MSFVPSQLTGEPVEVTIDFPVVFLGSGPPEPQVLPARLSGRVEVRGSREPVALLEVALFVATPKAPEGEEAPEEAATEEAPAEE